jgi:GxxExxY protein
MLILPNPLTPRIIGCAIEVHRNLGPGLLESSYSVCLICELQDAGLAFRHQVPVPVDYKGRHLDCAYRADFIVCDTVLVEIKSVERYAPIHTAQLLTYLKLLKLKEGLLINFNVQRLIDGVRRILN